MMEIKNLYKSFDDIKAVDDVSFDIKEKTVFGLIGTNGAGKSTTLRMLAGVYRPDAGSVLIDGEEVYDNVSAKKNLFFIADEPFFWPNSTPKTMGDYYARAYESFNTVRFNDYLGLFKMAPNRKISTFSKGMKKQLAIILGLSSMTKYLLCDETFDGLDPVMRQVVKSLMAKEIEDRGLTIVIASHNLRELEDICDCVGLLHKGGVLMAKDLEEMKISIQKVQCVFKNPDDYEAFAKDYEILSDKVQGSLHTMTIRSDRETIVERLEQVDTVFYEVLPLSLEEIFISETEVAGYDIRKIILG